LIVPEQEYFALGDNRNHSLDSRYWGFVPRQQIVGAAEIVYFSVRTPSPDDAELAQQGKPTAGQNDTMSNRAWLDFARWDRLFHVVR
jgi:signal peptidase I